MKNYTKKLYNKLFNEVNLILLFLIEYEYHIISPYLHCFFFFPKLNLVCPPARSALASKLIFHKKITLYFLEVIFRPHNKIMKIGCSRAAQSAIIFLIFG